MLHWWLYQMFEYELIPIIHKNFLNIKEGERNPSQLIFVYHPSDQELLRKNKTLSVIESGVRLFTTQADEEARLVERKVCFTLDAGKWGSVETPILSKGQLPLPSQSVGKRFCRQRDGATCGNSMVSSDNHLEIDHLWSDQRHPDCFRYS